MMKKIDCCLCSQIAGYRSNDLIARMLPGRPYVRRVMLETDLFAVVPSLGPLVAGHALVCPKPHIRRFADLSARDYEKFRCFETDLKCTLEQLYKADVHLFEHGSATMGTRVPCSVDHAHMHFVPLPRGFSLKEVEQIAWIEFDGSGEELRRLCGGGEYIYYQGPEGASRILLSSTPLESQYMRKVIARSLGWGGRWNWREHPDASSVDKAWQYFAANRT